MRARNWLTLLMFVGATACSGDPAGPEAEVVEEDGGIDAVEVVDTWDTATDARPDEKHTKPKDLQPAELPDAATDMPDLIDLVEPDEMIWQDTVEAIGETGGEVDVEQCDPDLPCDDDNPCTVGDKCTEDGCLGQPKECGDGLDCTFDLCQDGECSNELKPGWCHIAGKCRQEGEANPNNPCLECITAAKVYTWSADDTNVCDDGNGCTGSDFCEDGACMGESVDCDDANPCTDDICNGGECQYVPFDGVACEDGNLCTIEDLCVDGVCLAGEKLRECDDFNQCTYDACNPDEGCIYTPVDTPCEDGDLCTVGDVCISSICQPGQAADCDDGNLCTSDSCSTLIGCKHINNSLPCDDADPCTFGDQCFGGFCKKGSDPADCEDDNTCTKEWCQPFVGCQYQAINGLCSDGNGCTFGDHCDGGECVFQWEMECGDGNPCTDDICDPDFGCANVYNSTPCDDGNECTLGDQCVQGSCTPGTLEPECFVENPCASGKCDPAVGCVMTPEDGAPCDDTNICTVDDFCLGGECEPGADDVVDCDDGNVCTADWCDPVLGCLHENIEAACEDLNLCTENDQCVDGQCIGQPVNCDDDNQCTVDTCDKWQGCQYSVIISAFCQPQIIIEYPPRAAELISPPSTVNITGHVVHNAAPVAWVNINGTDIAVGADDTFAFPMQAVQGLNIIEAEIFDLFDGHDKIVQTYLMSTSYTPMNSGNPEVSMISDAVMIFLGQNVWDDNQPDPNDFATFFTYFFNGIDLASMMPNPLYENGSYKIKAEGLSHGPFSLDITCINGGLNMVAWIPNLHVKIKAKSKKWYLPSAGGDVDAKKVVMNMNVMLSVTPAGQVKAVLQNVSVDVQGLDVDLDGVLGFLFNWIVDFFEGMFAGMLEDQVKAAIKDSLPDALEKALQDLAFDTEFEIPPLFGDAQPVKLQMKSKVSTLDFSPIGGVIGLKAAVVTPKGVALDSKGSLHRGGCLGAEAPFAFWMLDEIEMGIFDDFINQIPYAMWWAGLLTIPLDPAAMGGGSFEEYGIKDLSLVATSLLPPVITDCASNLLQLQMGDMEIAASMDMWGMPVDVIMYATFTASIVIGVAQGEGGANVLEMGVKKIETVKLEVATVSENLVGSEDTLRLLIKEQVLPVFLEQITGNALASFPLPEMDMSGMIPGAPPEAKLEMTPKSQYRESGYTVITGSVHE